MAKVVMTEYNEPGIKDTLVYPECPHAKDLGYASKDVICTRVSEFGGNYCSRLNKGGLCPFDREKSIAAARDEVLKMTEYSDETKQAIFDILRGIVKSIDETVSELRELPTRENEEIINGLNLAKYIIRKRLK